jgi:hypothetical protein
MSLSLQGSMVRALVNVFVDVLDSFDGTTHLKIDVAVKLHQKFRRVRDHIAIVKDSITLVKCSPILRMGILWIAILFNKGLWREGLGKMLLADIVFNATCFTARAMKHILGKSMVELRELNRIWYLSRNHLINLLHCLNLVLLLQENKEMHMRKATLLVFNSVHQASNIAKVPIAYLCQ